MTAGDIRKALKKKFNDSRQYAIAEEVGLTTGTSHRRLDMIVVNCYESNSFRIDGFEIKVSTSDLRRELEDPEKHGAFFKLIDYYTLVAPKNVVAPLLDIIPKQWGIMYVGEDGSAKYYRKPLALRDEWNRDVPRGFFAGFVRNIQEHQPSKDELDAEYKRGFEEGEKHTKYLYERIKDNAEKLKAYEFLCTRFRLWGDDKIDEILDEFERFRALNLDCVKVNIDGTIARLEELKKKL